MTEEQTVLVANRGEIACRIHRAAKALGTVGAAAVPHIPALKSASKDENQYGRKGKVAFFAGVGD